MKNMSIPVHGVGVLHLELGKSRAGGQTFPFVVIVILWAPSIFLQRPLHMGSR